MKRIEVTREQVIEQLEKDIKMEASVKDDFYSMRISQSKEILKNGHGIFSSFRNEEIEVVIK